MASKARAQANLLGADGKIKATQFGNDTITSDMLAPNLELTGDYVKVPVGTTAERPVSPAVGHLRFNTTFGRLEQYVSDGWQAVDTPPTVTALSYSGGLLGADPAGGETVTITGTNFQSGANVTFGGTAAASVTVNSSTSITATTPAKTAGDYDVVVTNSNGLAATLQNGISYNGLPAFSSPAAGKIGESLAPNTAISTITIVAAEPDSGAISYSITSGALPGTLVLDSDGTIDGTTPDLSATTTYNFTVTATDDENQTSTRAFNLVVLRKIYAYSIPQSLMFNNDDSQYLSWTPASAGNRKTWTWSGWVKRGNSGYIHPFFFGVVTNDTNRDLFGFLNNDTFLFYGVTNGTVHSNLTTSQVFRDFSSWYHVVISIDTTQATASDRIKLYINGEQITSFSTATYPSQNKDFLVNNTQQHTVGASLESSAKYFDGYLADVHFIDGQALAPTAFAESYNDVWVPKAYSGSYGTNGFHLPMTNDTSVEAFNVVTYRGNTQTGHAINGVGFKPDLIIQKNRTGTNNWPVTDSVRGIGNTIFTSGTFIEQTSRTDDVQAFTDDGFVVGSSERVNGGIMVAYCWKAGDSNVSNTVGSITSTVRANQTYGFSIVSYTGTGSAATIGHGLGAAPNLIIVKNRNSELNWAVGNTSIGWGNYLKLDSSAGSTSASQVFGGTTPTSTVFSVGTNTQTNESSSNFVAYCWVEKEGYSKFGTYTGNGSADGPEITTGFRPAFLICKSSSSTGNWRVVDDARSTTDPRDAGLNINEGEQTEFTQNTANFTDTGFKIIDTGGANTSGVTFLYIAFADTRDYAFWRDESGNNNDWQPVNTGAYRVTTDTPTE